MASQEELKLKIKKLMKFKEDKDLAAFLELNDIGNISEKNNKILQQILSKLSEEKEEDNNEQIELLKAILEESKKKEAYEIEIDDETKELLRGEDGKPGKPGERGLPGLNGKDGQDGKDGTTPVRGVDYMTIEDKTEIAIDAINLLESFEGDSRLDAKAIKNIEKNIDTSLFELNASQIKNLPKPRIIHQGGSGLEYISASGVRKKDGVSNINFIGGIVTPTINGVDITVDNDVATWGSITGTITDQTDLTTYIADQLATQDTLQEVTDNGATTTNTITLSPTGNNEALIVNGSGTGSAIYITHAGSGTKLEIDSTGAGDMINAGSGAFVVDNSGQTSITNTSTQLSLINNGAVKTDLFTDSSGNLSITTSGGTISLPNAQELALSATSNSNGRITGIGRAEFVNNGFFGVSGTSYISFNTSVGSIFSQPIRVNDDIKLAFGNARDYTIGHHSASDTLQIVDGSTLNSNVRMQLDSSGNFVFGGTTASARLHAISTTEQLRLGYDASNYASFTVNSTGNLTIETPSNGITLVSNSRSTAGGIVFQREPDLATNNRYSVMNTVQAATTNSPSANASFTAIDFTPRYSGTGTLKTLYGAFFSPLNSGTGTVTNLTGSAYWVRNTSTGTVTTMKGVEVLAPTNSGTIGGSVYGAFINNQGLSGVTNSYGLFVSAQSGSTNNYAIKTGTGLVDFGDDTNIAGTLTVTDTTEQARFRYDSSNYLSLTTGSAGDTDFGINGTDYMRLTNDGALLVGTTSESASAKVQIDSTTQGFLPPRMTTTQKNAISSPATGLVVYDTTLNKLAVYTGSGWETVTSI